MILSDAEIRARSLGRERLVTPFENGRNRNCRYYVSAGRCFLPRTGADPDDGADVWPIEPTETLVVMTAERVRIPADLCAWFSPINSLAQGGLLLINGSLIEPGYDGPLSCYLVNFSRQRLKIKQGQPIAKLHFHQLSQPPAALHETRLDDVEYARNLRSSAMDYSVSFLDVAGVREAAAEIAYRKVNQSLVVGGVVVALLAVYGTVQPLVNRWLFGTHTASHSEVSILNQEVEALRGRLLELESGKTTGTGGTAGLDSAADTAGAADAAGASSPDGAAATGRPVTSDGAAGTGDAVDSGGRTTPASP